MNRQKLRSEYYKQLMEWQAQATSMDNLQGDRFCDHAIDAWRVCYRLSRRTAKTHVLRNRLKRLREAWASQAERAARCGGDRTCFVKAQVADEALRMLERAILETFDCAKLGRSGEETAAMAKDTVRPQNEADEKN